jgi:protein Tex
MDIISALASEFKIRQGQVENVVKLIDDGCTIPFIARYRKEMTGSLDDQVLRELGDRLTYLRGLEKRREEVSNSIESQGKMSEEISAALGKAATLTEIEDIYRPYKQKRRTRATIAREKGFEPLADLIMEQKLNESDIKLEAAKYVNPEKDVQTLEEALNGALDITAETISDNAVLRRLIRETAMRDGLLASKAAKKEDSVYSGFYDYKEKAAAIPGHRILAIDRGEREGFLNVSLNLDNTKPIDYIVKAYVKSNTFTSDLVRSAGDDAYERLIFPSIERDVRNELTDRAQEQAIKVFAANLKPLLMQPPVKGKTVLALDPAYRTGCKVAVVDETGKVLDKTVVYPTPPQSKTEESKATVTALIKKYGVDVISIGNGTASKETEIFTSELIKELDCPVSYMVVSEAGASVYSASKLGAQEFPDYDVSLRSAVSIARRLQDPLAELVKIDPKSIGVGQYQHDLKQARLDESLGGVVEDCVNSVGADLNTASFSLLSHVSGISTSVAKNVVLYREENGAFKNRRQLLKVPKLGPKAFEQCAGFLRIPGGDVLDNTSVHPESYPAAKKLLELCGHTLDDVASGNISDLREKVKASGEGEIADKIGVGIPTLNDIINELLKPGRDPRDELPKPMLRTDILEMKDLKEGMELTGTVRNVIDFGAFVDIGVHQDGLVHISQICDRFIRHPSEALTVGDIVKVRVLTVDAVKKRISLTMKGVS